MGLGNSTGYLTSSSNAWISGKYHNTAITLGVSSSNINSYAASSILLTGLQFEKAPFSTAFEYRPYNIELQLCQRYFQDIPGFNSWRAFGAGGDRGTNLARTYIKLSTIMRARPYVSFIGTPVISYSGADSDITSVANYMQAAGGSLDLTATIAAGVGFVAQCRPSTNVLKYRQTLGFRV